MDLLRGLGALVFGKKDDELVKLDGQLYYLDPQNASNTKQLIFRNAKCAIKRTSAAYHYQLVLSRIFEEEEDENLEEESEHIFLIDPCLCFRVSRSNDKTPPRFIWADAADDSGSCGWEFLVDAATPSVTSKLFEEAIFSCMFEKVNTKAHEVAEQAEINGFICEMQKMGAER